MGAEPSKLEIIICPSMRASEVPDACTGACVFLSFSVGFFDLDGDDGLDSCRGRRCGLGSTAAGCATQHQGTGRERRGRPAPSVSPRTQPPRGLSRGARVARALLAGRWSSSFVNR